MNLTHEYLAIDERDSVAYTWKTYKGFTIRPVTSTEQYYHDLIARLANTIRKALVYGGTPEIRSSLQKFAISTILADRSSTMVEALGLLTTEGVPLSSTEIIQQCDWRNLPLEDKSVELILGDDAINMLDWDQFPTFLQEAKRVLVTGGWFACHLLVQPSEAYRRQTITEVNEAYRSGAIASFYEYASRVNFAFYNHLNYRMGWQASIAGLDKALNDGLITDDYSFTTRFKNCKSSFACPPLDLWDELVRRYFEVHQIFYPTEYDYCRFEPLYLLKKIA